MYEEFKKFIYSQLEDFEIVLNADMSKYTSFRAGGNTDILLNINNIGKLKTILKEIRANKIKYSVIGNGTNILVKDSGYHGVLIRVCENMNSFYVKENMIIAQSGALLSSVSKAAADNSIGGLEFLNGIPGSVGGGVCMNAGAYGSEIKDVLSKVEILSFDGSIKTVPAENLNLRYRNSDIKDSGDIVIGAVFVGVFKNKDEIFSQMAELNAKRRDKQPLEYPSAGSTFKRPQGYFAGKLIEECGLKGKGIGGAKVSEKHAGFIINYNNATAKDILDTIEMVRETVKAKFGVVLENEVKILE